MTGRGTREATRPGNLHLEGPRFPAPGSNSQPLLYLEMNTGSIPKPCPPPPESTSGLFKPRAVLSTEDLPCTMWHLVLHFFSCFLTVPTVCLSLTQVADSLRRNAKVPPLYSPCILEHHLLSGGAQAPPAPLVSAYTAGAP